MRREELLSLRLHEAVARKLQGAPELIEEVEGKIERLSQMGQLHHPSITHENRDGVVSRNRSIASE